MSLAQVDMFAAPPAPVPQRSGRTIRDYQATAIARVKEKLAEHQSTLLVLPTGCGKTFTASRVVAEWPGPALWVAHREELIDQGRADLQTVTGEQVAKEKAETRAWSARIVVGSVQTLKGGRLEEFARRHPATLLVVDEAHHAVSPSYKAILSAYPAAKVLGLTATPDRADERAMGQVFESVAFVYEILEAIKAGYLCRYRWKRVLVDAVDLSGVGTVANDLNQGELDAVMATEEALQGVVRPTLDLAGDRRTIMFTTSVENAHRMAEVFNRYRAGCARAVDGGTQIDERRAILRGHKDGAYQYLCNVGVLTEGYDDPAVSCIGMARPTKSRALYAQMAGRGFRICPGKADLLVLDFAGNSGRHSLVTGADILDGKWDDEVAAKARDLAEADEMLDAVEAMERAVELVAGQRKEDERRKQIRANVRSRTQDVDPFAVFHIGHEAGEADEERFGVAPTEKQLAMLGNAGIDLAAVKTRAQASRLIGTIISRREHGLATFKQLRTLQRAGITKINVGFEKASRLITALKTNGWRLTPEQVDGILARQPGEDLY